MALNIDLVNGAINVYETGESPKVYFGPAYASGKIYPSGSLKGIIKSFSVVSHNLVDCSDGNYSNILQSSTSGMGVSASFNVDIDGGEFSNIYIDNPTGNSYALGDTITIDGSVFDGSGSIVLKVTELDIDGISIYIDGDNYQVEWDNLIVGGTSPVSLQDAISLLSILFSSLGNTYRVFSFLISQESNNSPTITVLENTMGINPDMLSKSRYSAGYYSVAFGFEPNYEKTAVFIGNYTRSAYSPDISSDTINVSAGWVSNELYISSSYSPSGLQDDILNYCPIEIRFYN